MTTNEIVHEAARPPPPGLLFTKLYAPAERAQTVARDRLLDRLREAAGVPVTVIAAPAGYGKTTLLGTWRESEPAERAVAWLSLDEGDDDPVVLWSHALEAFRRVCPSFDGSISSALLAGAPLLDVVLPRLANELTQQPDVSLVLDDFHVLSSGAARKSVAWLAERAPPGFRLLVASRSEPALPLAALRAHGELLELRAQELGFTSEEANALLNDRLELGLTAADVDELVDRTEGWPAGLYLAALLLRGVDDRHAFVSNYGGASRHVVDFLVAEVLDAHDPALQELMLRCSILERLCGPLCDTVLDRQDSGEMLDTLSRTNLFLVALDDRGEWHRFHHLFAQLLRAELEHRAPGLAPTLHRRAYLWYRNRGSPYEAIKHAIEADAYAEAGELIARSWIDLANTGRYATVLAWLRRFPDDVMCQDASLLLVKAWVLSLCARREEASEATAAVERLGQLHRGPLPDGFGSPEGSLATLRAVLPWGDVGSGLENALRAAELEGPDSPGHPNICWALGMGHYFSGEVDEADRFFAQAAEVAPAREQWIIAASGLAYRSLIAGEQGRREDQGRLAEQATEVARAHGVEEVDGEVHVASGVFHAAVARPNDALPLLERGVAVLRVFGQPIELVNALIHQASALKEFGNREGVAVAIGHARNVVASCPDPGILAERLAALEATPRRQREPRSELSDRELVVLRMLKGPLSERDIGRELYISHSTIHTHVRSIYVKLGVSSRSAAVEKAQQLRLH